MHRIFRLFVVALLLSLLPIGASRKLIRAQTPSRTSPSVCFTDTLHGWLARANHVWSTTNGGRTWEPRFTGAFQKPNDFTSSIRCAGDAAWVLFVGFGAASEQKPYVVYRTLDGGRHWRPELEEGYFSSVYPKAHVREGIGGYPGPLVVVNPTTAYFLGTNIPVGRHGQVVFTGTTTGGASWFDHPVSCLYADRRFTIRFRSATAGWLTGACNGHEALLTTTNGGHSFVRRQLP